MYPYNDGTLLVKDYPFFGFDREVTTEQLRDLKVPNPFKDRVMRNYDEYIQSLKVTSAWYRDINTFYDGDETGKYIIHYHYTWIDDEIRLVLMLGDQILDIYDVPETHNKRIPIAVSGFAYE